MKTNREKSGEWRVKRIGYGIKRRPHSLSALYVLPSGTAAFSFPRKYARKIAKQLLKYAKLATLAT